MGSNTITHTVTVEADPQTVFQYLTEGEKLAKWFPSRAETEPRVGGAYRFSFLTPDGSQDHEREGTFQRLEPGRAVEYDWNFGAGPTHVSFALEPGNPGTTVILKHTGFGDSKEDAEAVRMHNEGWQLFCQNLKSVLEGGPDKRVELGWMA